MKVFAYFSLIMASVAFADAGRFSEAGQYLKNREYAKATAIYEDLAASGDAEAEYMIGIFYMFGLHYEENDSEAIRIFSRLCEEYVEPCTTLGEVYVQQEEYDQAKTAFLKAAESGDLKAYGDLSILYGNPKWGKRDLREAERWRDRLDRADRAAYDLKESLTRHRLQDVAGGGS